MIAVQGLSKSYRVGGHAVQYLTIREALASAARRAVGLAPAATAAERFFALEGVSFEVAAGEVVGIVGRNGAGKSTLLKILSRITWPTAGTAALYGRVGSLLEVGTGFNHELTGRENVFLNGTILGMRRAEIRRRFDEIVEFSGVERFIDTPVKHYSSGMFMRLAFSVAAHLESEILFVDEVLAVGDAEFQKKCLAKMREAGDSGRTVLFVSHNMQAVTRLCSRAIYLEAGKVALDGDAPAVAAAYMRSYGDSRASRAWDEGAGPGDAWVRLRSVRVVGEDGRPLGAVDIARPFGIEVGFDVLAPGRVLVPRVSLSDSDGACLFWSFEVDSPWHRRERPEGRYAATAWVPGHLLSEGFVNVGVSVHAMDAKVPHADAPDAVSFQAFERPGGLAARGDYGGHIQGAVRPLLRWTCEYDRPGAAAGRGGGES